MSYRLIRHETISDAIKRIVVEQIDKARTGLESPPGSQDDAIHDARVCFKKIRAVLRLVQSEFDADTFRQENMCYRDAGRRLSAVRDAAALREAFDKLIDRFADQLATDAFAELQQSIKKSSASKQPEKKNAMLAVAKMIAAARRRVEHWPIQQEDFSALEQGLKHVYKRGRQGFASAWAQPTVENFHEWRKDVKYLRYQIRILKPTWPGTLKGIEDELDRLGEYLSEDHDLALLRQRALEPAEQTDNRMDIEAVIALIDRRRGELQGEAKSLGDRLYAEKPRAFAARLGAYWQAWSAASRVDAMAGN
jgi:CHAD domain-containing protein